MAPIRILYEDPYLVLCVKPVGVLSEDSPSGACMPGLLREHYRALGQNDYIATVHRLDRLVGGVMLFSRRREITGKLTAAIAEHRVTKEYLAVLRGTPEKDSDTLTDLLFRDAAHNKSYVVKRMRGGVKQAKLHYEILARQDGLSLVHIRLETGRTHQIRAQMAAAGCPLLGDGKYGRERINRTYGETGQMLYSYKLTFTLPTDAGILEYLRGRTFQVPQVAFAEKYFPGFTLPDVESEPKTET